MFRESMAFLAAATTEAMRSGIRRAASLEAMRTQTRAWHRAEPARRGQIIPYVITECETGGPGDPPAWLRVSGSRGYVLLRLITASPPNASSDSVAGSGMPARA